MATQEKTIDAEGRQVAAKPAGVYRHPVTGAEIIAVYTPKYGNPQADAYEHLGFVYDRPAPDAVQEQVLADIPNLPAVTRDDKEVRGPQPAVQNPVTEASVETKADAAQAAADAAEKSAQPEEKTQKKGLFGRKK